MKNIHVLPTDKPSNLLFEKISNRYYTNSRRKENSKNVQNQNIYITSDEEIKEGWYFNTSKAINKAVFIKNEDVKALKTIYGEKVSHLEKIILTTDQDLIKDGVQSIDDEFLEWFVKNPNCEKVEVERGYLGMWGFCKSNEIISKDKIYYKIIIPKEEPKALTKLEIARNIAAIGIGKKKEPKQETLEEAAEKYSSIAFYGRQDLYDGFIAGAKWMQERMYSEEEVFTICRAFATFVQRNGPSYKKQQEWFEQFKKK